MPKGDPRFSDCSMINLGYLCYLYGKSTRKAEYVRLGVEMYDRYLGMKPKTGAGSDFHATRPFALFAHRLNQDGELKGSRRAASLILAKSYLTMYWGNYGSGKAFLSEMWDHNINMAGFVAADALAITFPDVPDIHIPGIRAICKEAVGRILVKGDLNENASNYSPLGASYALDLITLEDRIDGVGQSKNFYNFFTRWRDTCSPMMFLPEFGDSYFTHELFPLDLICVMEQAARCYQDFSFTAEAHRLMGLYGTRGVVTDEYLFRALPLMELTEMSPLHDRAGMRNVSAVQYRTLDGQQKPETLDKLILRTGDKPGDAMIYVDLYSRGSHAHEFRRSAVLYYEAGGIPLYRNLGRHSVRSGNNGNVFWVGEFASFPGHPKSNVWNTMTIPVDRLTPTNRPGEYVFASGRLDFRTFPQTDLKSVTFDNLRLEGNAGVKLIEGFESTDVFPLALRTRYKMMFEVGSGATEGLRSQQVNWLPNMGGLGLELPKAWVGTSVQTADYDLIKFDYKYDGALPYFHFRGWCARQLDMGDAVLSCEVRQAQVKQYGADAWGRMDCTDYQSPGSTLSRRLLLTKEGLLVIVDYFTPGPRSVGQAAGQLWQLYTLAERGTDYFAGKSDGEIPQADGVKRPERRMLVKFSASSAATCDVEAFKPGYLAAGRFEGGKNIRYTDFYTAYSKLKIGHRPVTMVQVVVPLLKNQEAKAVASEIQIVADDSGACWVEYPAFQKSGRVRVRVTGDGMERVER